MRSHSEVLWGKDLSIQIGGEAKLNPLHERNFFQIVPISVNGPNIYNVAQSRNLDIIFIMSLTLILTEVQSLQKSEAKFWNRNHSIQQDYQGLCGSHMADNLCSLPLFFKCPPPWYESNMYVQILENYRKENKNFLIILLFNYPESLNILIIYVFYAFRHFFFTSCVILYVGF